MQNILIFINMSLTMITGKWDLTGQMSLRMKSSLEVGWVERLHFATVLIFWGFMELYEIGAR